MIIKYFSGSEKVRNGLLHVVKVMTNFYFYIFFRLEKICEQMLNVGSSRTMLQSLWFNTFTPYCAAGPSPLVIIGVTKCYRHEYG